MGVCIGQLGSRGRQSSSALASPSLPPSLPLSLPLRRCTAQHRSAGTGNTPLPTRPGPVVLVRSDREYLGSLVASRPTPAPVCGDVGRDSLPGRPTPQTRDLINHRQTPPPRSCVLCAVCCCSVLVIVLACSATLRASIVCLLCVLVAVAVAVTGWLPACVWSSVLPHPSSIACLRACLPRQLHLLFALGTGFGQQDSASQSNHLTRPTTWGMSCCSKSSDNPSRAHYSRSEPRGLSHILNPSGDTQQHVVSGRSFDAYEENGRLYHAWRRGTYPYPTDEVSHPASPAAYNSEAQRRCSENEADTIWCITWCIALS